MTATPAHDAEPAGARRRRERRLWIAVGLAIGAILVSLYPLQFVLDFLRARNLLRLSIAAIFLLALAAAVWWLARRRAPLAAWGILAAAGAVYVGAAAWLDVPQERLHLVQYGALALLLEAAFAARRAPAGRLGVAWRALAAAAAIGLLDEIVQGILPNRQYDPRDVLFNLLSAGLALASAAALRRSLASSGR